ncbi:MAG: DUF167 domain-containing protein [Nitrospirota bacterium]
MKAKAKSRPSRPEATGVTFSVRIQPRASKNGASRMEDGSLKIRLTAPPVDGAANEALIAYLAKALAVSKSSVEILSGHTSREKRLRISGVNGEDIDRLLNIKDQ